MFFKVSKHKNNYNLRSPNSQIPLPNRCFFFYCTLQLQKNLIRTSFYNPSSPPLQHLEDLATSEWRVCTKNSLGPKSNLQIHVFRTVLSFEKQLQKTMSSSYVSLTILHSLLFLLSSLSSSQNPNTSSASRSSTSTHFSVVCVTIDSVKNRQKITEAMKLVAADQVKRAVINARPFSETLDEGAAPNWRYRYSSH